VLGIVCGGPLMHQSRPSSRPPRAQRLCKVTILVPEDCAERIRQFAHELRAQQHVEPIPTQLEWQTVSASAELMVSPDCMPGALSATPGRLVGTDIVGPSRCWDSWTRLPKGGLRTE
jgi:hypothetical protein